MCLNTSYQKYTLPSISFIFLIWLSSETMAQCHLNDFNGLKALYEQTGGDDWTNNSGWELVRDHETPPVGCDLSSMSGVTLNGSGRVDTLFLQANNLEGTIPSELSLMTDLFMLDLGENKLSGVIPSNIGNLANLRSIFLNDNQLSSEIPESFWDMLFLIKIVLGNNNLTGQISAKIAQLNLLQDLNLPGNRLGGPIPKEIGALNQLKILNLASNQLSGTIPKEIGSLPVVLSLFLHSNQFSGQLPPELGNLSLLNTFYVNNNNLSGCFHPHLSNLCGQISNYSIDPGNNFDASWNDFCSSGSGDCFTTCTDPEYTLLVDIYNQTGGAAWISNAGWLGDCDPCGYTSGTPWNGIKCDGDNIRVLGLYLDANNLNGTIPSGIHNLTCLDTLDLSMNSLSGMIPEDLGDLESITEIDLSNNNLSGCYETNLLNLCPIVTTPFSLANPLLSDWNLFCSNNIGFCSDCSETKIYWTGGVDNKWDKAANWSTGCVPTAGDTVYLFKGETVLIRPNQDVSARKIYIDTQDTLIVNWNSSNRGSLSLLGGDTAIINQGLLRIKGDLNIQDMSDVGLLNLGTLQIYQHGNFLSDFSANTNTVCIINKGMVQNDSSINLSNAYQGISNSGYFISGGNIQISNMTIAGFRHTDAEFENSMSGLINIVDVSAGDGLAIFNSFKNYGLIQVVSPYSYGLYAGTIANICNYSGATIQITNSTNNGLILLDDSKIVNHPGATINIDDIFHVPFEATLGTEFNNLGNLDIKN